MKLNVDTYLNHEEREREQIHAPAVEQGATVHDFQLSQKQNQQTIVGLISLQ